MIKTQLKPLLKRHFLFSILFHLISAFSFMVILNDVRLKILLMGLSGFSLILTLLSRHRTLSQIKVLFHQSQKISSMSSKFEMSVHTLKNKTSLLKESAENQSAALTETSSALTEISGMVDQNVRYAERALEESTQSQSHVNHGKDLVEKMLTTMLEISESSQKMAQQTETNNRELEKIVSVINEITEKTHIIHDIVFQTKLLSFNASVEAARAGEHGKGFSVVAEEIGNLAEMSGKAAKEISNLLNMSSSTVHEIVKANQVKISGLMHSNSEKVKSGGECAKSCDLALTDIYTAVSQVHEMVSKITVASKEQSIGIEQISKAIQSMEAIGAQNYSDAEEGAQFNFEMAKETSNLIKGSKILLDLLSGSSRAFHSGPSLHTSPGVRTYPSSVAAFTPLSDKAKSEVIVAPAIPLKIASGQNFADYPDENDPNFEDF